MLLQKASMKIPFSWGAVGGCPERARCSGSHFWRHCSPVHRAAQDWAAVLPSKELMVHMLLEFLTHSWGDELKVLHANMSNRQAVSLVLALHPIYHSKVDTSVVKCEVVLHAKNVFCRESFRYAICWLTSCRLFCTTFGLFNRSWMIQEIIFCLILLLWGYFCSS